MNVSINNENQRNEDIYNKRWLKSINTGDSNINTFGIANTQVELFYSIYCKFIEKKIKNHYSGRDLKGISILEIGCGRGTASIYLNKQFNCKSIGIDFSNISIEVANNNNSRHGTNVDFFKADVFDPEFILNESNTKDFDVIISLGVLEHIENIQECFNIHNRLLKKNGLFCAMIVPEKESIQEKFSGLNRLLINLSKITPWTDSNKFSHLDKKTLSKTAEVYRSYEKAIYFGNKLKLAKFTNIETVEANPFPTIRPVPQIIESAIVLFYYILMKLFKFIFKKSIFFNCSTKYSRCHFLIGSST